MRVLRRALLAGLIVTAMVSSDARAQQDNVTVKVFPANGFPGSVIDVSAAGLPPNTKVAILMACPNAVRAPISEQLYDGPYTDRHGSFAGFLIKAVPGTGISLPSGCLIYLGYANIGFINFGVYYLYQRGTHRFTNRCAIAMCVQVKARPERVRAGYRERFRIAGWGGAQAVVHIRYPDGLTVTSIHQLSWQGTASFSEPIPASTRGHVKVSVTTRLSGGGDNAGKATSNTSFTVLH